MNGTGGLEAAVKLVGVMCSFIHHSQPSSDRHVSTEVCCNRNVKDWKRFSGRSILAAGSVRWQDWVDTQGVLIEELDILGGIGIERLRQCVSHELGWAGLGGYPTRATAGASRPSAAPRRAPGSLLWSPTCS